MSKKQRNGLLGILAISATLVSGQQKALIPQQNSNIELTVHLLSGIAQGEMTDDVPQDLAGTVKQLRSIFSYKGYKLAESFLLRGRLGAGARAAGILPGDGGLKYEFRYAMITASTPPLLRISGLLVVLTKAPRRVGAQTIIDTVASVQTDLDIREGQKTVVGKSSVSSTGDALIIIIVPKIVD